MNKQSLKSTIKRALSERNDVIFAYVFGSFVKSDQFRDIDIAVFTRIEPDLLQIGELQAKLEAETKMAVDLTELNGLFKKSPLFAFKIVTEGELLLNNNVQQHDDYKTKVLLRYYDTAPLREKMNNAFKKRLEKGKFGERNYA